MKLEVELWKFLFLFLFLSFFAADISKKALKDSSLVKFPLLKLSFLQEIQPKKLQETGFTMFMVVLSALK